MFLKALTLKGFKSFAESTTLEMQPGVTVVVGPNGSGKSNVVDAIGWVLGAQAPSAVRSQKMEDVIFAGTSKRQALGRAEVGLTIDNSAGLLPIEFSEVTVTRTLWRSGESEYAINNVPCRLLDVQELFSDTGVGRQQHVIVGQGQIDAVLNARPEDRRLVIEEAAGVLKHRKRKERSERRLAATEGNLTRLNDLLREVRRQLRPLERQADAARRHGDLVTELRALHVFVAGRELSTLKRRLGDATAAKAELRNEERLLVTQLSDLDLAVMSAESELAALGGSEVGEALARAQALREKARGQLALLAERRKGVDRERAAFVDQGVIASLEADAARLQSDIDALGGEAEGLGPDVAALAEAEGELEAAHEAYEAEWGEGVPAPSGRAAEVRGELGSLRRLLDRADADADKAQRRVANLRAKVERLDEEAARAAAQLAELPPEAEVVGAVVHGGRGARGAERGARAAEQRRDAAQAERHTWTARADALGQALDAARSRAGATRLAAVDGVVGTLLDLVDIDPGLGGRRRGRVRRGPRRGGGRLGRLGPPCPRRPRQRRRARRRAGDGRGARASHAAARRRAGAPPRPASAGRGGSAPRRPARRGRGRRRRLVRRGRRGAGASRRRGRHPYRRAVRPRRVEGVHRHDGRDRCRVRRGTRAGVGRRRGRRCRRWPPTARPPRPWPRPAPPRPMRRPHATAGSARSPAPPRPPSAPPPTATTRSPSSTCWPSRATTPPSGWRATASGPPSSPPSCRASRPRSTRCGSAPRPWPTPATGSTSAAGRWRTGAPISTSGAPRSPIGTRSCAAGSPRSTSAWPGRSRPAARPRSAASSWTRPRRRSTGWPRSSASGSPSSTSG